MKISTNAIGNYNPYQINNTLKTNSAAPTTKVDAVTKEEKEFFVQLYPENKKEIMDYHFYKSTGKMSGVALGSIFDRRG
ncbi:MAG: hypothetical protein NTX22_10885 [Ignavibacteriales bacterium]|nr:hypothetical protein [Ignavibacteriales bacterium]